MTSVNDDHPIALFDGYCNLCNGFVNFIIDRDPGGQFRFAALQTEAGRELLSSRGFGKSVPESVVLLENGKVYTRSTAALRIARRLSGFWPIIGAVVVIPGPIRDWVYAIIAANRYEWFGQRDTCRLPTPEIMGRFIT